MRRYWRDSEATQAAFTNEGWYRTGDKGTLDSHGNVYVQGRIKNMIVLPNGMNVYPEDMEAVLGEQDEIRECVVCGIEGRLNSVKLTAVVIPSNINNISLSEKELVSVAIKKANTQLAPHQRITDVHVWKGEKFPKTGLGKVKRQEILRFLKKGNKAESHSEVSNTEKDPWILVQNILAQISGVDPANIIPSSNLDLDLGLSSLSLVETTLMIEEEFGISLDDDELSKLKTAGCLHAFILRGISTEKLLSMPTWSLKWSAQIVRNFIQQTLFFPLHKALARPFSVVGAEQLKQLQSPALFVANHCSHMDTLTISRALFPYLKGRLAVAAAADYIYRNKIFGMLASLLLNTFPLARQGAVRASLEHCADLVENGWSVLIYPEGTRSPKGRLLPFKKGPGLLASELGIPVVPIGILGSQKILPKGNTIPKPGPLQIIIGRPIIVPPNKSPEAAVSMLRKAIKDLLKSTNLKTCDRKNRLATNANIQDRNKVIIPNAFG
jgi:long-chain acyl-CoA synthetase